MDFLTIDWDFFVPEKAAWDIAHKESELFLTLLWTLRGGLVDLCKTSGEEQGFWKDLGVDLPERVCVSDSHAFAYPMPFEADRVVLFDAHHDCWDSHNDGKVYCHNWLRMWLEADEAREALWVYPKHLIDNWGKQDVPEDLRSRVEAVEWNGLIELGDIEAVHICRSGCWTPPWLDKGFIKFVKDGFGDDVHSMQKGVWDSMNCRWTEQETADVVKVHEQRMEHFRELEAMPC